MASISARHQNRFLTLNLLPNYDWVKHEPVLRPVRRSLHGPVSSSFQFLPLESFVIA